MSAEAESFEVHEAFLLAFALTCRQRNCHPFFHCSKQVGGCPKFGNLAQNPDKGQR